MLMRAFDAYAQKIRNVRPQFIRFKDGKLIKHALTCLTEFQLEMLFVWFLREKKEMCPTIGAALCKEVISDFIRASSHEYGFYTQLENSIRRAERPAAVRIHSDAQQFRNAFENLARSFDADRLAINNDRKPAQPERNDGN